MIPTAKDIRELLEGYCLDSKLTVSLTGNIVDTSPTISNVSAFTQVKRNNVIKGVGVPDDTRILSFDETAQTITMDKNATATTVGVALTIEYYASLSDDWLIRRRDRMVVPLVQSWIRQTLQEETTAVEYYSGNGTDIMILNRRHITELVGLEYVSFADDAVANLQESVVLIGDEGILKARNRVLEGFTPAIFIKGTNNIKVTYKYGYANESDIPGEICEAILMMVAAQALVLIGGRGGGGDISVLNFSPSYGTRGKYSHVINQLDKDSYSMLSQHFTYVGGAG